MKRKKKISLFLLLLFFIIVFLNLYTETFPLHFLNLSKDTQQKDNLRVVTYNIGLNNQNTRQKEGIQQFTDLLTTINADIVVLPESRLWNKKGLRQALDSLYDYSIFPFFRSKEIYVETAIYSRYPLSDVQSLKKDYIYTADVNLPNQQKIKLIACHLASNQKNSQLNAGEGLLKNIQQGKEKRLREVQDIYEYCEDSKDIPLLICGDLNDISGSATIKTIQKQLNVEDAWWKSGFGYGATFWGKHLYLRLDHILFSNHFKVNKTFVINNKLSDHYPFVADLSLTE